MKIRTKLLLGFAAAIAVSAAMGLSAAVGVRRTSDIATELYDKPLMAADFSRSALENFLRLERAMNAVLAGDDPSALAELPKTLAALQQTVLDDLAIVVERFPGGAGAAPVGDVERAVRDYAAETTRLGKAIAKSPQDAAAAASLREERSARLKAVDERFDILIEAAKEQGLNFRDDAAALGASTLLVTEIAIAINLTLGVFIALLLARGIARPITGITSTMTRLAGGETELAIPALGRSDEVGEMAKAVEVFKRQAIEAAHLEALRIQSQTEREQRAERIAACAASFNETVAEFIHTIAGAAAQMEEMAGNVATTTDQAARRAKGAAGAAEQASANVQTVASATEELSATTAEIAQQVNVSAATAEKAAGEASLADRRIHALAETAAEIGKVVQLIEQIAGQTNLLALNATIEAARAGEAGKGFAVVAGEVKSLAKQTAGFTEQIRAQIAKVQGATEETVAAIRSIGATIASVNEVATTIAAAVEEQGAATREIANSAQLAAKDTIEVSANVGGVSQLNGEVGSAASQALAAAGELSRQSGRLRQEVERFLADIRAA